jgi:hypothetical protein
MPRVGAAKPLRSVDRPADEPAGRTALNSAVVNSPEVSKRIQDVDWTSDDSIWKRLSGLYRAQDLQTAGVANLDLRSHEVKLLRQVSVDPQRRRPVGELLLRLLSEPLDTKTPRGLRRHQALHDLCLLHPYIDNLRQFLATRLGQNDLSTVRFFYSGHMTLATLSLFQLLRSLELGGAAAIRSTSSGTFPAQTVIEEMLKTQATSTLGPSDPPVGTSAQARERFFAEARLAASEGRMLIADRAGGLLNGDAIPDDIRALMRAGTIRFLMHNSDDRQALQPFAQEAWVVNVAGSLLKAREGRVIGEQFALLAVREAREAWGTRLGEGHVVVKGFGLLGKSVVRALRRLGMPGERITVVEPDRSKHRAAAAMGCRVVADDQPSSHERVAIFVATPGTSIDADNAWAYGREALVLAITSAGKGVDVNSIKQAASKPGRIVNARHGVYGGLADGGSPSFDLKFHRADTTGENDRDVTLINCSCQQSTAGFHYACDALNLREAPWPDRFNATVAAVSLGVVTAMQLAGPGVWPVDRHLETAALRLYAAAGLSGVRPLDQVAEESYQARYRDLVSFTPHAPPAASR